MGIELFLKVPHWITLNISPSHSVSGSVQKEKKKKSTQLSKLKMSTTIELTGREHVQGGMQLGSKIQVKVEVNWRPWIGEGTHKFNLIKPIVGSHWRFLLLISS